MGEPRLVETADPEEAFTALSDATRVAIVRELWNADADSVSFSELRSAVGVRDSGQFNYHLDELVDRFVRATDDGYELTLAGQHVVGAIHAGAFTMSGRMDPIDLPDSCPACGGDRTFRYEDEHVRIDCDSCDAGLNGGVPPGVFAGYDRGDAPAVTARYMRTLVQHVGNGFCWYCDGRARPTVYEVGEGEDLSAETAALFEGLPMVRYDCERCGAEVTGDVGTSLLDHPAVVAFYYDHGRNVREHPFWDFTALNTDRARIVEHDPLRARVTYPVDDDALTLTVDEELAVLDTERSDG